MVTEIAENVKKIREKKGLSQENLAEALKVNQSTYAKMESGKLRISADRLKIIARVPEVDYHFLYDESAFENMVNEPNSPYKLLRNAQDQAQKNLELIRSIDVTADWFIEDLRKHARFANFKTGDKALFNSHQVIIEDVAYSGNDSKIQTFLYSIKDGDVQRTVPEYLLQRLPK